MSGSIISILVDMDHPDPWKLKEEDLFPEKIFKKGIPSVSEATEITYKTLERIGVGLTQSAYDQITKECSMLAEIGYNGRIYPKITSIPEGEDANRIFKVAEGGSYALSRTICADEIPQMRIAFFRNDGLSKVDPVLHYLNLSFSRHAHGKNSSIYQPQAFDITKKKFEGSFDKSKWLLDLATPDDILTWIIMDRIREIPVESPKFVLSEGLMRLPTRYYGNYGSTGFDFHDTIAVESGRIVKQGCDAANWPFVGHGGVVAFRSK